MRERRDPGPCRFITRSWKSSPTIAIASVFWFGGLRVIWGTVTLGILVAFMQYAQRFFRPIMDLSDKYNIPPVCHGLRGARLQLLDTPPRSSSPPSVELQEEGRVEFDHVWFALPQAGDSGG